MRPLSLQWPKIMKVFVILVLGMSTSFKLESARRILSMSSHYDVCLNVINLASHTCAQSYQHWRQNTDGGTGLSMVSRDKEGLWCLPELLDALEDAMRDIKVVEDCSTIQLIASAAHCLEVPLLKRTDVEITILSVPPAGAHVPRRHPAGTILLYKRLYGACTLTSVIVSSGGTVQREVKREELAEDDLMRRLGGLSRLLESPNARPSAVLEVALYPPTRADEGLSEYSPYEGDTREMLQLSIPPAMLPFAFESRAAYRAAQEEASSRRASEKTLASAWESSSAVLAGMETHVGGLHSEISAIVRRVLASRSLPSETLRALGVGHIRGVLLYGPPGTGKTLIARELARQLNATETTKIVNGPSIFDKYVGEAERNVRELFADADAEWKLRGEQSRLHLIVLDELDSIAKTRSGSTGDGSSTRDAVVNQLLSEMDGVRQRGNVLVVGLTNRKDLVDPALLRPGRLEVHVEIVPPDYEGREEILQIVLREMRRAGLVSTVSFDSLVRRLAGGSEGMSGAELAGVARSAASFAIERAYAEAVASPARGHYSALGGDIRQARQHQAESLRVELCDADFVRALGEVWAAKGGPPGVARVLATRLQRAVKRSAKRLAM